jgi:hypothetical protein
MKPSIVKDWRQKVYASKCRYFLISCSGAPALFHHCKAADDERVNLKFALRVVAVLCSEGFPPWAISSASSTSSHAAAKKWPRRLAPARSRRQTNGPESPGLTAFSRSNFEEHSFFLLQLFRRHQDIRRRLILLHGDSFTGHSELRGPAGMHRR